MVPYETFPTPSPSPEPTPKVEPFPTTFVTGVIVAVAIVGIGLLVYFVKHRGFKMQATP